MLWQMTENKEHNVRRVGGILLGTLIAVGCTGDDDDVVGTEVAAIEIASGHQQSGPANARLVAPLVARVLDASNAPVSRERVSWSITPAGSLSSSVSVSDVDGLARVDVVLGPQGAHTVLARVAAKPGLTVSFTVTATAPPTLTQLTPATFGPGDTVVAAGTDLGGATTVSVGDVPAELVVVTATALTFVAPACLAGGTQPVAARVGTATTNALSATVQSEAAELALEVGDHVSIDPDRAAACARFPAVSGPDTVEYLVVPQLAGRSTGRTSSFRVAGAGVVAAGAAATAAAAGTPADAFHAMLRTRERHWAELPRSAPRAEGVLPSAVVTTPPAEGSSRTFWVCGSLTDCEPFQQVTAVARYVGEHAAIYVDQQAPANGLTATQIDDLGTLFDDRLYEVTSRAFGSESDIDDNGVSIILMTNAVNRLTPSSECDEGFIAGFFFGLDLLRGQANSNEGEVFYSIVADPEGSISCTHSVDRITRLVPVTFTHEFQHMISFHQHVLVRGAASPEILWLNEGLSHLAEELAGRSFLPQDQTRFSQFVVNNLLNGFRYFKNPTGHFLLAPDTAIGTLEERGAAWNFLRWVVDQFGPEVTRRLVETSLTGGANVENVTGEPFSRLVADWALAMWADDLPGFTAPPRLTFTSWDFRTTYDGLHRDLPAFFDRPFPIVPVVVDDGTTLAQGGTLKAGSPDYIRLVLAPGSAAFGLEFTDGSGAPIPPNLVPRLTVLRTR